MMVRELDEALDHLDVAALAALEVLITMPAISGWSTASTLALAETIASTRRRVFELRQYRRDQLAADAQAAEAARQKATPRQYRRG
jgi:hypothetical protein